MYKGLKAMQKTQLKRESLSRKRLALLIFGLGEKGISEEKLEEELRKARDSYGKDHRGGIGRLGYRNDLQSTLEEFQYWGMIKIENRAGEGELPKLHYTWIGEGIQDYVEKNAFH